MIAQMWCEIFPRNEFPKSQSEKKLDFRKLLKKKPDSILLCYNFLNEATWKI